MVSCPPGKKFPDGSSSLNLLCVEGNWVSTNSEWTTVPECIRMFKPELPLYMNFNIERVINK